MTLDEKYENKQYSFKVASFTDKAVSISVYIFPGAVHSPVGGADLSAK